MATTRYGLTGPMTAYPGFSAKAQYSADVGLVTLGVSAATVDLSASAASVTMTESAASITLSHTNTE